MKKIIFTGCMIALLLAVFVGCGRAGSTVHSSSSPSHSSSTPPVISTPPRVSAPAVSSSICRSYRISYTLTLISNNSVGHNWGTTVSCDGDSIRSGEIITGTVGSYVTIRANVTEYDSIPDSGGGSLRLRLIDGTSDSVTISVKENRGKYAGNTAKWKFTCSIKEQ